MAIELAALDRHDVRVASFTRLFEYSNNDERNYVVQLAKMAHKDQVRILLLQDDGVLYGFVGLSVEILGGKPSIAIKFMFASVPFRGKQYAGLGGMTIGEFFIGEVVNIAERFGRYVPVRYIALQPANDALEVYYHRQGFVPLDPPTWMFLKL